MDWHGSTLIRDVPGDGKRLFGPGATPTTFALMATRTTSKGVVIST